MKFTPEQQKIMDVEGWFFASGYVHALIHGPFNSSEDVVHHLALQARKSEFHREVYLAIPWTKADNKISQGEGWWLAPNGSVYGNFGDTELVHKHILNQAELGDPVCEKIIRKVIKSKLLSGGNNGISKTDFFDP